MDKYLYELKITDGESTHDYTTEVELYGKGIGDARKFAEEYANFLLKASEVVVRSINETLGLKTKPGKIAYSLRLVGIRKIELPPPAASSPEL